MDNQYIAIVNGRNLSISTKHSIEICNFIRNKSLFRAKKQLNLVLENKLAIPLKKFHKDRGHRKGKIGPGFFPQKATKEIISLLNSLEANAQNKGLNTDSLYIKEIIANKASRPLHTGRKQRQLMKRTHIKIIGMEKQETEKIQEKEKKK